MRFQLGKAELYTRWSRFSKDVFGHEQVYTRFIVTGLGTDVPDGEWAVITGASIWDFAAHFRLGGQEVWIPGWPERESFEDVNDYRVTGSP